MRKTEFVFIHDVARPFVTVDLVNRLFLHDKSHAVVIPVIDVVDTIKQVESNRVVRTVDRSVLRAVQTPQRLSYEKLLKWYKLSYSCEITDESMLAELNDEPVYVIPGERLNKKVTFAEDML